MGHKSQVLLVCRPGCLAFHVGGGQSISRASRGKRASTGIFVWETFRIARSFDKCFSRVVLTHVNVRQPEFPVASEHLRVSPPYVGVSEMIHILRHSDSTLVGLRSRYISSNLEVVLSRKLNFSLNASHTCVFRLASMGIFSVDACFVRGCTARNAYDTFKIVARKRNNGYVHKNACNSDEMFSFC